MQCRGDVAGATSHKAVSFLTQGWVRTVRRACASFPAVCKARPPSETTDGCDRVRVGQGKQVDATRKRYKRGRWLLKPGTMVDAFKVMRPIGRGGMGEVYLARDTALGRKVALKVVHPRRLGSDEVRQRFLKEARMTARFSHPQST